VRERSETGGAFPCSGRREESLEKRSSRRSHISLCDVRGQWPARIFRQVRLTVLMDPGHRGRTFAIQFSYFAAQSIPALNLNYTAPKIPALWLNARRLGRVPILPSRERTASVLATLEQLARPVPNPVGPSDLRPKNARRASRTRKRSENSPEF